MSRLPDETGCNRFTWQSCGLFHVARIQRYMDWKRSPLYAIADDYHAVRCSV
jgi:hypothetical protein